MRLRGEGAPARSGVCLHAVLDQLSGLLADEHGRRVRVAVGDLRHGRGVHDPQALDPTDPQASVEDALALDANASRLIDGWRKEAKLPPLASRVAWLQLGEQMGLGHAAENKIILHNVDQE